MPRPFEEAVDVFDEQVLRLLLSFIEEFYQLYGRFPTVPETRTALLKPSNK